MLLDLARCADLVFVGEDRGRGGLGGLRRPDARRACPNRSLLVVKQGASGATAFHRSRRHRRGHHLRAPPHRRRRRRVGAGDAFAAGFLSATLRGLAACAERLRHGAPHGRRAVTVPGGPRHRPARDHADRLARPRRHRVGETARLGPGWTQDVRGADEEVRTP